MLAQVLVLARPRSSPRSRAPRRPSPPDRRRPLLWAAIGVGLALRVAWVLVATEAPMPLQDAAEYLRTGQDLLDGYLPRFQSGAPSAYWAPGYPLLLVPFLALAEWVGGPRPELVASLVNAVAATTTIPLTAFLATRWLGERAGLVAAWLVALTPALVFWTATAHTESAFTPVFLGALAVGTVALDRQPATWWWVGAGLLTGVAVLIRGPGVVLFLVPLLVVRARRGTWRGTLRPTGLLVAGAAVLLVPWTVRNGVQVGVWIPTSTSNVMGPCLSHHDDGRPQFTDPTPRLLEDCYRHSPFDDARLRAVYQQLGGLPADWEFDQPDEASWYRDGMAEATRWALSHPVEEVRLSAEKVWEAWEDEHRVVEVARGFHADNPTEPWTFRLQLLANLWLWALEALAVAALVTVPAARRGWPIWGPVAAMTVLIVGGLAYPNYRYPVLPLVAALAAAFLAGPRAVPWRQAPAP